ncbi:MAG: purine-nucleoside phosphorylase, partial [Desulfobacteraceae bacterium]
DDPEAFPLAAPSRSATKELADAVARAGLSHKTGRIWTTDGIYRETEKKINFFRQKGAIGVEMECSALFSAARYRKQKIAALLVVSDELSASSWHPGFRDPRFKQARKDAARVITGLCNG